MPTYEYEEARYAEGYSAVCGCDEAGRGPLCGPVVAAACILPRGLVIDGLNDSKKLTEKKREKVFDEICANALSYSIALSTVEEINETNILEATLLAMRRAVEGLALRPYYLTQLQMCQIYLQLAMHDFSTSTTATRGKALSRPPRELWRFGTVLRHSLAQK